jgi:hypothetical protein
MREQPYNGLSLGRQPHYKYGSPFTVKFTGQYLLSKPRAVEYASR